VPRPRRRIPVWIAATGEATARLAAARGLPLLLGMDATNDEKRRLARHHAPHTSAHVAYVADTCAEAEDALRRAMPGWLATTSQYTRIDGTDSTGGPPAIRMPTSSTCSAFTRSGRPNHAYGGSPRR
jgi:alkanesulfonate monooxygenase SsuD/methylene tetrahydromethanopterin reductase-like flavin-dependent oxidoreductase (luciferase family)